MGARLAKFVASFSDLSTVVAYLSSSETERPVVAVTYFFLYFVYPCVFVRSSLYDVLTQNVCFIIS